MKKQKRLGLVVLMLILLVGGYGAFKWYEYSKTEVLENVETILCDIGINQLERIELKIKDTVVFVKDTVGWVREDKPALGYDQELMNALITDFIQAISFEKVSNVQDMAGYGIDEDANMVTLYGKDGQVQTLRIGKDVTGRDATYVSVDDNNEEIYVIENSKLGLVRRDERGFIKKSLNLDVLKQLQTFEIVSKGQVLLKVSPNAGVGAPGYEKWVLAGPFARSHEMSTEAVAQMIGAIKEFTKDYYVADVTEEAKVEYGLSEPSLKLILNDTVEIVFGHVQNEFVYFYTTEEPYIYKMPSSKITLFEEINPFTLIRKQIYVPQIESLKQVEVNYGKESVVIKWVVGEDAQVARVAYVNDQVVAEEVAKGLVNEIASLSLHSQLMNAELEQNQERTPEVVIRYTFKNNAVKTLELRPFDPSYYVLKDNGMIEFVVEKKQFITIWNKLQKAKEIS
ncbi:MAG: DUF4340 domain-containing protein [Cellulosilyticaceae bacterium]